MPRKISDQRQIKRIFEFPRDNVDTEIMIWLSGEEYYGELKVYNRNWDIIRMATYDKHENYHGELKQWRAKNDLFAHLWYKRNMEVADFSGTVSETRNFSTISRKRRTSSGFVR